MLNYKDIRFIFLDKLESLCFGKCGSFDNRKTDLSVLPALADSDDHFVELIDDLDLFVHRRKAFHNQTGLINLKMLNADKI